MVAIGDRERNHSIDFACGFFTMYVILYHIQWFSGVNDVWWMKFMHVFDFFMPWFFFKGGMFAIHKEEKSVVLNSVRRLLIPFFFYGIFGCCVNSFFLCVDGDFTWKHHLLRPFKVLLMEGAFPCNGPLWFLLSLFVVRLIANKMMGRALPVVIWALLIWSLGIILYFCDLKVPAYFYNIPTGLFFYMAGIWLKDLQYKPKVFNISICFFVLCIYLCHTHVDMRINMLIEGKYILYAFESVSGIIVVNNIAKEIPCDRTKSIIYVGRNSMDFYVLHFPIMLLVLYGCSLLQLNTPFLKFLFCIICVFPILYVYVFIKHYGKSTFTLNRMR